MPGYKLSSKALRDVAEILGYLHRHEPSQADTTEDELFEVFRDLGSGRAVGHRRSDLTDRNLLFYLCGPYMIVFRQSKQTIQVIRVVHGSRNLSRLL